MQKTYADVRMIGEALPTSEKTVPAHLLAAGEIKFEGFRFRRAPKLDKAMLAYADHAKRAATAGPN